jgi:hypothetical protein
MQAIARRERIVLDRLSQPQTDILSILANTMMAVGYPALHIPFALRTTRRWLTNLRPIVKVLLKEVDIE